MHSPSTRSPAKVTERVRIFFAIFVAVLLALASATWVYLEKARAKREATARLPSATPSPEALQDRAAAAAMNNYLTRLRVQIRDHEAAYARLGQSRALSWDIREKADIDRDWKIVNAFLETNKRLTDSLQFGEGYIRAELNSAKVPDSVRDSVLDLYAKTEKPALPLELRVRECDQALGENALAILSLLDANWGLWKRDPATGRLDFTSAEAFTAFRDHVTKMEAAATERKVAQDQLANFQRRHPMPK